MSSEQQEVVSACILTLQSGRSLALSMCFIMFLKERFQKHLLGRDKVTETL